MVVRRTFGVSHPRLVTMSAPSDPGSEDLLRSGPPPGEVEVDQCCPADGILKDLQAIQTHANALYKWASREIDNIVKDELEAASKPSFEAAVAAALTMIEYSASSMIEAQTEAMTTRKRKLRSGESIYSMRFVAATRKPKACWIDNTGCLQQPGTSSHHEFNTSVPNRTTGTQRQATMTIRYHNDGERPVPSVRRGDKTASLPAPDTQIEYSVPLVQIADNTQLDTQWYSEIDIQAPSPEEESQNIKRMRASVWDVAFVSGLYDAGPDQLD